MARSFDIRRWPAARITAATAIAIFSCTVGVASAASEGGAGPPEGGAAAPGAPAITDVICTSGCVGLRAATRGGTIQVSGSNLASVDQVTFKGGSAPIVAPVSAAGDTSVTAKVPGGAVSGKVRVRDAYGNRSAPSPEEIEIHPASELGSAGSLELTEAETTPTTAYFFGVRKPRLDYIVNSSQRLNDLRIDVVDASGGVVRSYFRNDVAANTTQTVRWDGNAADGTPASGGSYSFRVSSQSGQRARASSRRTAGQLGFHLYGYIFPIRGPHTYGDGIGAPRAGHTHQGQDVLSACGLDLVAVRGGRVQYNGYQGAAGNYVVIDGKATGQDFAYMHMVAPSPLQEGQVVHTGQVIGHVGQTGDATTCHLHFEIWGAPGWYEGGHFLDPAPALKAWDRYS